MNEYHFGTKVFPKSHDNFFSQTGNGPMERKNNYNQQEKKTREKNSICYDKYHDR